MSNQQHFKPGDVVRLKSGGDAMTISNIDGEDVHVTWMDAGKLHHDVIKQYMLVAAANPLDRVPRSL